MSTARETTDARYHPHTHARSELPKKRYADLAEAAEACRRIVEADDLNGRLRNSAPSPYPCSDPECGGWHVGNWSDEAYRNRPRDGGDDGG